MIFRTIRYFSGSLAMTGLIFLATGLYVFFVTTPRIVTIPSANTEVVEFVDGAVDEVWGCSKESIISGLEALLADA